MMGRQVVFMKETVRMMIERLRHRYYSEVPETRKDYAKSRRFFTMDGVTANSIAVLVTGTILAGYLKMLGVSDALNGIISALPVLLTVTQPIGAVLSERLHRRKLFVCTLALIHRLLFAGMFCVPLLFRDVGLRLVVLFVFYILAHGLGGLIGPAANNWIVSLTPNRVRGRYFSIREKYLIVISSTVSMVMGYVLDLFKGAGNEAGAYLTVAAVVAILAVGNFSALSHIMEPPVKQMPSGVKFRDLFILPFKSKAFLPVVVFHMLWNISAQIVLPYLGVFWVSDLHLSYTYIMVVAFAMSIFRAVILKRWGRLADHTSWAFVTKIAIVVLAVSHMVLLFIVPSNAVWFYFLQSILSNVSWAVMGMAVLNIQFDYAPEEGRTLYIGANTAIGGLAGFAASFVGAGVVSLFEKLNLTFLGAPLKGQQILLVISGILMLTCAAYIHVFVEKHKKKSNKQRKEKQIQA